MHTDPKDMHGQDLFRIISDFGLDKGQVRLSHMCVTQEMLALIYNSVDLTVNISDAEGFCLATLESLSCGTPILVNQTGGLQEQVTDGRNKFGGLIPPASKALVGSQQVPYIYEDRVGEQDFVNELYSLYKLWKNKREKYKEMGLKGHEHVLK